MDTIAHVTLTYLVSVSRNEVGLELDATDEELMAAAELYVLNDMDMNEWIPNDIEIEIGGNE